MAIEKILYDYLFGLVQAAAGGSALHGASVHKTPYAAIKTSKVIQVGPVAPDVAPSPGNEELEEFNGEATLILLKKVELPAANADPDNAYAAAREEVLAMAAAIGLAVIDDNRLGGRVRDALPVRLPRDFTSIQQQPHAVANLVLLINQTGSLVEDK